MSYHGARSIRLIAKYFLLSFIILTLISSSALAKKPVKLTEREMAEVQGAIAPLVILGALVTSYAVNVVFDLAMDSEYRTAWVDTVSNLAEGEWDQAARSSVPLREKPIEYGKSPVNIGLAVTGPIGKIAGSSKLGKVISVGAENGASKAYIAGVKAGVRKEMAETAYEVPFTCLVRTNGNLNFETVQCAGDSVLDKATDPLTYLNIHQKGKVRQESYRVRIGEKGTDLLGESKKTKAIEELSTIVSQVKKHDQDNTPDPVSASRTSQARVAQQSGGGGGSGRSSSTAVTFDSNKVLANIKQGVAEVNKATGNTGSPFDLSRYSSPSQSKPAPAAKTAPAAPVRVTPPSNVRTIADNRADIARRTAAISGPSASKSKSSSGSRSSSSGKK